jgi:hypothetical protein
MVTSSKSLNEELYIISFNLYTLSMTLFHATHSISVSHVLYIWIKVLLLDTFWDERSRIVTLCNELLYKVGFNLNTVYMTRFDAT